MPHTRWSFFLLSFASMASVSDEASDIKPQLETIVITATGEARKKIDLPDTITSFDEVTIDRVSPSHPSEILNRAAGVHVNNLGGEGHMTSIRQPITTRGVYLFLEDGIPVRPSGFFNHNALYEVNVPQSGLLEVIKGPGSALYGSDAIGGVINSISRQPPDSAEGMVNVELGSYDWRRALFSVGNRYGKHSVLVNANITDNAGYRDDADYNRESLTGRWDMEASDTLNVKTLLSFTHVDQSGVSSLEAFDYENNTTKNRFQGDTGFREVEALRLSSEFAWTLDAQRSLMLTPYFRDNTTRMSPSWMVTYDPNERESQFQSLGLLARYRVKVAESVLWIAGIDVDYSPSKYTEEAISHTTDVDDPSIYTGYTRLGQKNYDFDAEQTSLSPYLHVEMQLTDRLLASLGMRYDYFDIDYDDRLGNADNSVFIPQLNRSVTHLRPEDQTVNFEALSPKVGLVYRFNTLHAAYFNYRQAFAIPSVGTLFRAGSTQNSDDLRPIKADSYELGFRGTLSPSLNYEATVFHMEISDDIVSVVNGRERNRFNAGETEHQGIELALNGVLTDEWSYALAWTKTWQQYKHFSYTCCFPPQNIDVSGNDVGKAPDMIGNFTIAYMPAALSSLSLELEWEHLGEYYTDETNTAKYDGHDLVNLRANYWINDELEVYLRLQNITDELYSTYTSNQVGDPDISYRPGLPRSVYSGVKWYF